MNQAKQVVIFNKTLAERLDSGCLQRIVVTPGGATIKTPLTLDDCAKLVTGLTVLRTAMKWAIADVIRYAELTFPIAQFEDWWESLAKTIPYMALKDIRRVGYNFPPNRRHLGLSFSHHREVCPLEQEKQDVFLDKAEKEGWNSQRLREEIHSPIKSNSHTCVCPACGALHAKKMGGRKEKPLDKCSKCGMPCVLKKGKTVCEFCLEQMNKKEVKSHGLES